MFEAGKPVRRAARELVAAYEETCLNALVDHLARVLDAYRTQELDVHQADRMIHQYHRAAQELWEFCWATDVETTARTRKVWTESVDWWQRGAPKKRP